MLKRKLEELIQLRQQTIQNFTKSIVNLQQEQDCVQKEIEVIKTVLLGESTFPDSGGLLNAVNVARPRIEIGDHVWSLLFGSYYKWTKVENHQHCSIKLDGRVREYETCRDLKFIGALVFLPGKLSIDDRDIVGDELLYLYLSVIKPHSFCQVRMRALFLEEMTSAILHFVPGFDVNVLRYVIPDYIDGARLSDTFQTQ
jgi:hypothetical protein